MIENSSKAEMYFKHSQLMQARGQNYFDIASSEVISMIPESAERILEVGCGAGETLRVLKEQRLLAQRTCEVVGVDIEASAIERAQKILDAAYLIDAEETPFDIYQDGYFDVLIMHYVLEHVVNPWAMIRRWLPLVRKDGYLVASVPNISNYKFLKRLILNNEFTHEPAGILDWTHLRYFTKTSFIKLLKDANLEILDVAGSPPETKAGRKMKLLFYIKPSTKRFFHYAYTVLARKNGDSSTSDYMPFEETYTL